MTRRRKIVLFSPLFLSAGVFLLVTAKVPSQTTDTTSELKADLAHADELRQARRYAEEFDYLSTLPAGNGPEWEIKVGARKSLLLSKLLPNKDLTLAQEVVGDLVRRYPDDPNVYLAKWRQANLRLFDLPYRSRDPRGAGAALGLLLKEHPGVPEAGLIRIDYGMAFYVQGRYAEAAAQFQTVLDSKAGLPPDRIAYSMYMLGDTLVRLNRRDEGITAWKSLVAQYPDVSWGRAAASRLPREDAPEPDPNVPR